MATTKKPTSALQAVYQRILKLDRLLHTKMCHPDYQDYIQHTVRKGFKAPITSKHISLGQWTIRGRRSYFYAVPAEHLRQPVAFKAMTTQNVEMETKRAEQQLAKLTIHAHAIRAMPGYQYSHLAFDQGDAIASCPAEAGTWQLNVAKQEVAGKRQATVFQFDPTGVFVALLRLTPKGEQDGYVEPEAHPMYQPKEPRRQRVKYLPSALAGICLPQWIIERHGDTPPYVRMLDIIEDRGYPLMFVTGMAGGFTRPGDSTLVGFAKGDWMMRDGYFQMVLRG